MSELEVKTAYQINNVQVSKIVVRQLSFEEMADAAALAVTLKKDDAPFAGIFRTCRMKEQLTFVMADGSSVRPDFIHLMSIPIKISKELMPLLEIDGEMGEILTKGDGISTPIHIKLGTPIKGADGKEISELEFLASTYGDVENVLGETDNLSQTVALIKYVAKPIGMLSLPSWAAKKVTIADGAFIMREILPSFLE